MPSRGEVPETCAIRELQQETGLIARDIELALTVPMPGNHTQYFYTAITWDKGPDIELHPRPDLTSTTQSLEGAMWHREADEDDVWARFVPIEQFWRLCFFKHRPGFVAALKNFRLTLPHTGEDLESLDFAIRRLGIH